MNYTIIDTIVIPNAGRTDSIRVSRTENGNNEPATQWVSGGRFTVFGNDASRCRTVNAFVAEFIEDSASNKEMNLFTDKHNN